MKEKELDPLAEGYNAYYYESYGLCSIPSLKPLKGKSQQCRRCMNFSTNFLFNKFLKGPTYVINCFRVINKSYIQKRKKLTINNNKALVPI